MFSHRLYWSLQSASTKLFGVLDLYFFSIGYFLPPPLPTSHGWLLFLHLWQEYIFPALSFVLSHVYPRCSWQPLHAFQCVASKTLVTTWCKLIDVSKKGRISPLWTVCCDALLNPTEIIMHAFQCVASKTLVTTWCKLIDVSKKGRISPLWTFRCDALLNPTEIIMPIKKISIHNKRKQMICSSFYAYSRWPQKCYCKGMG